MADSNAQSKFARYCLIFFSFALWGFTCLLLLNLQGQTHRSSLSPEPSSALKNINPDTGWFPSSIDPLFSWESDEQGWELESEVPSPGSPLNNPSTMQKAQISQKAASCGKFSLSVPVHFPTPATVCRDNTTVSNSQSLQGIRFIAYDVYVPHDCGGFVGCLFFLKDKDGLWYQARSGKALLPGQWTTVTADLRGGSPDITPLGHLGQWDANQATMVRIVGLTFYGDKKYDGHILVDNFRGWMRPHRFSPMISKLLGGGPDVEPIAPDRLAALNALAKKAEAFKDEPIRVLNFRTDPAVIESTLAKADVPKVCKLDTFTLRFELNRQIDNPFDPDKCDIRCVVKTPSGAVMEHIGFWYQDYNRSDRFSGDELEPIGRPEWRVRITPREEGDYTYSLRIKLREDTRDDTLETSPRSFICLPSNNRGFIRVSQKDPKYFEFENGEFFYPIGHNLHSPIDLRCWKEIFKQDPPAGRGLNMYAEFFTKMQQNQENIAEVWMSSWWLGIEWTRQWRNYHGPGRYSLQHAWKLDYLLELARTHGINVHLVLDNHGKFSTWCDWEWDLNPYNSSADPKNGVISSSEEFFTNETTRRWHRNKLRYITARWGADPTIMGWELVSEYDLVGGRHRRDQSARSRFHRSKTLQDWAQEMITFMRKSDLYQHPITIHYASDYSFIDAQIARTPLFDYVVTDAYRPDRGYSRIARTMYDDWINAPLNQYTKKPFWITEYGGDFNAGTPGALDADAHCGLWATWMNGGSGSPLFWWYDFIDRNDLYGYYRAFANYIAGEDRRGINGIVDHLTVFSGNPSGVLKGDTYRWKTGAYGWVYNENAMSLMPPANERPTHEGAECMIPELEPGVYLVEYWDCYAGRVVKSETKNVRTSENLLLKFPLFTNNMAFKVKRK